MRKNKVGIRIFCLILATVFVVGSSDFTFAQTAGKSPEQFANLVVFVQTSNLDENDSSTNFMNTKEYDFAGAESYKDKAKKFWLNEIHGEKNTYVKSLANYLDVVSFGQFKVANFLPQYSEDTETTDQIVPIKANGISDTDLMKTVETACKAGSNSSINQGNTDSNKVGNISGADLDKDNDGYIDNVTIIVQGDNPTDTGADTYPHKANYNGGAKIAGKKVDTYNIINSDAAFVSQQEGVVCHEFMHSIGFPDLYKYNSASGEVPVGTWDIMSGVSSFLQYPLAYMRKAIKGWIDIDEITTNQKGKVLVTPSTENGNQAYILKSALSDTEFFVVEYRKQSTNKYSNDLELKIGGSGLIVYRVNTRIERLTNSGSENAIVVFKKDADAPLIGNTTDLNEAYFSEESGRTEFGSTDLSAEQNVLKYSDGTNSGIKLSNIGSAGDTISFDVEFAETNNVEYWKNLGDGYLSNDDSAGIDIAMNSKNVPYTAIETNSEIFVKEKTDQGWVNVGNGAAVTSSQGGGTTPKIQVYNDIPYLFYNDLKNGSFTLKMKKYEDGSWKDLGVVSNGLAQCYDVYTGSDGVYMLYSTGEMDPYKYNVKKYNGTSFTTIKENVATGSLYSPAIIQWKNKIYVAFRDINKSNQIVFKSIDTASGNNTVQDIDNSLKAVSLKLTATETGIYVGINSSGENPGLNVQKYDGTSFKKVGNNFTSSEAAYYDMAQSNNIPYIVLNNQTTKKTAVYYEENGTWVQKGLDVDNRIPKDLSFTVQNGIIYVAMLQESSEAGYPIVKYNITPDNTGQKPGDETSGTGGENPGTGGENPGTGGENPGTGGENPGTGGENPGTGGENPGTGGDNQGTGGDNPGTGGDNPGSNITKPPVVVKVSKPARVVMKTIKRGRKKATIRWKKAKGATSYQVYRATKKNGKYKKAKTVSYKKLYWTNNKLKGNKKYYFKVRAVKKYQGKNYYGTFSKIKYVKVKR